jgi:hypothetical protein
VIAIGTQPPSHPSPATPGVGDIITALVQTVRSAIRVYSTRLRVLPTIFTAFLTAVFDLPVFAHTGFQNPARLSRKPGPASVRALLVFLLSPVWHHSCPIFPIFVSNSPPTQFTLSAE